MSDFHLILLRRGGESALTCILVNHRWNEEYSHESHSVLIDNYAVQHLSLWKADSSIRSG